MKTSICTDRAHMKKTVKKECRQFSANRFNNSGKMGTLPTEPTRNRKPEEPPAKWRHWIHKLKHPSSRNGSEQHQPSKQLLLKKPRSPLVTEKGQDMRSRWRNMCLGTVKRPKVWFLVPRKAAVSSFLLWAHVHIIWPFFFLIDLSGFFFQISRRFYILRK